MSKKLIFTSIFAALTGLFQPTEAFETGGLTVSGELLYLKPSVEQSSYVITSSENVFNGEFFPNGKRHLNSPDYKPGFRVDALYTPCESTIGYDFRFTYFDASYANSTRGNFLFDTIGSPGDGAQAPEDTFYNGKAKVHDHFKFYTIDAALHRFNFDSCADSLTVLLGLQYANIKYNRHASSEGSFHDHADLREVSNSLKTSSRLWGVGPLFGIDYTYNLTSSDCCYGEFKLKTNLRGIILCSNSHANFSYDTLRTANTAGVHYNNDQSWHVNPGFDAKLGAGYDFCFCGFNTAIELGYEWIWYNNAINTITGYDVAFAGDSLDVYNNFSVHGPYLKIGASF